MGNLVLNWKDYIETSAKLVSEGCILLENKDNTLPLKKGQTVSIFGRIQTKYYKSGTGSGGMVNVSHVINIPEGLRNGGIVELNEELFETYTKWEEENPFNEGTGWGTEPWSQIEMPHTRELVENAKSKSDIAIVIIGRTAGEDRDNTNSEGAYLLSKEEENMLRLVRETFDKMVVLLNIGSLMDINFIDDIKPDATMIVWQGGMIGGEGTARVLDGRANPSGRLTSTVAYKLEDFPSYNNYGDDTRNFYAEDIFVGYRYFETFAKDKVRYPFGYGLSYTTFERQCLNSRVENQKVIMEVKVTNKGDVSGKHSVLMFVKAPNGKLGKAARVLVAFNKTKELNPGESETLTLTGEFSTFASYDDLGKTGHQSSFILENGEYEVFVGGDVREASSVFKFNIDEDIILETFEKTLWPGNSFERMVAGEDGTVTYENVPALDYDENQRRLDNLMEEIPYKPCDYTLKDVKEGKCSLEDFVAGFTDDELYAIVRGEGMGSSLVTAGTASAFAGVTKSLREKGIPAVCCDDGPSGMRLDSGAKAFSLPNGTLIASSFNLELVEQLYSFTSMEMCNNKVDCLLGPGMNINRYPLNGRNFEYFSEDPYLTGMMGIANLKGLAAYGNYGTVKHFCGNNQEFRRLHIDSVISERALREIYLKGFEMTIKAGLCKSVMTTYGSLNGLWTASNYDLTYTVLRKQWKFDGIAMTDWWADMNRRGEKQCKTDFVAMAQAVNDLYMCVPNGETFEYKENTKEGIEDGSLKKCELQRIALNVCKFAMNTQSFERLHNNGNVITIEGMEAVEDDIDMSDVEYISFVDDVTIPLDYKPSRAGTNFIIPLEMVNVGFYEITVAASSRLTEVAQMTCTLYYTGVPFLTYTFNGTEGKVVAITKKFYCHNKMAVFRLNVAKNGLDVKSISFHRVEGERPDRGF